MRILGVDPGLRITGYGLLEAENQFKVKLLEAGVIRTSADLKIPDRLKKIHDSLSCIVNEYKPDVLVLEKIYSHYKHPSTAILMAHARGVVCLLCGLGQIQLVSYPASRIKKAISGSGRASKEQMQYMVAELLKLKKMPEPVDVTDALGLALSFINIELRGIK